ncbi:MAG: hypothetical protein WD646_04230 [Actinomycetota bacterium]
MKLAAIAFGALMLFGACADEDPTTATPPETTEEAMSTDAADGGTVQATDSDLGEILTDAEGRTVYVFLNDDAGVSNCTGDCAVTWPPLTVDGEPTAGDGADEALLDSIEHPDGGTQVTYNEQPLYHYSADQETGDTEGQGIGGNWYVVGPDGETIRE